MATMLAALGALSTPLAAQIERDTIPVPPSGRAVAIGLAATLGDSWQYEAAELGFVWRRARGAIGALSVSGRIGSFIDEGAILGGSRGFLFGATLAARSPMAKITEIGDEFSLTAVGLDLTIEATGYLGANSPLPQGAQWGAVAVLPGLRAGGSKGPRYAILAGPTLFIGSQTDWRALIAIRVETPLARGEGHP